MNTLRLDEVDKELRKIGAKYNGVKDEYYPVFHIQQPTILLFDIYKTKPDRKYYEYAEYGLYIYGYNNEYQYIVLDLYKQNSDMIKRLESDGSEIKLEGKTEDANKMIGDIKKTFKWR